MRKWFYIEWYRYLFGKADNPDFTVWYKRIWCRIRRHPNGCIYYNLNGFEPDYRCKDCGDEI